jgi:hypothetical protein
VQQHRDTICARPGQCIARQMRRPRPGPGFAVPKISTQLNIYAGPGRAAIKHQRRPGRRPSFSQLRRQLPRSCTNTQICARPDLSAARHPHKPRPRCSTDWTCTQALPAQQHCLDAYGRAAASPKNIRAGLGLAAELFGARRINACNAEEALFSASLAHMTRLLAGRTLERGGFACMTGNKSNSVYDLPRFKPCSPSMLPME